MLTQAPKGTRDITPEQSHLWHYMEDAMRAACAAAGYREARTPVFEHTELFLRGIGDTTDVVQKEMYTFTDKGGRSVTLKPEGTAGVVRMLVEHKLFAEALPAKMYYVSCPNFRYEKPQNGRLREFHQFGVEAFGAPQATVDAEQIALAWDLLTGLGLTGLSLHVNSIGCPVCRPVFHERLQAFLVERLDKLCDTCQERFTRNPMRILDCKSPDCQAQLVGAPRVLDCLCPDCRAHMQTLQETLTRIAIPFELDPGIVRGLDYYTKTVFEIIAQMPGGSLTVCGGGRYDGLTEALGGPALPGVGFGMGMERVLMLLDAQGKAPPLPPQVQVYVCTQGDAARDAALPLAQNLRRAGVAADCDHMGRSLKAQFKHADKCGARLVLVLGEAELLAETVTLRDMRTRQETQVPLPALTEAVLACLAQGGLTPVN
ncbi:MAG: histidine--tRNA ligase [Oscillospiraceae bacterium]|nr:histidine--tRNA ligase [Oscillospiraceae bacterium]